jgi:uroporphyrinogen-III synthase
VSRFRVLLTRPRPDSEAVAAVLESRGIDALIEPLLNVALRRNVPALDVAGVQAILLTSANGARALEAALGAAPAGRHMPLFVVGDATARTARAAGFDSVQVADGNVARRWPALLPAHWIPARVRFCMWRALRSLVISPVISARAALQCAEWCFTKPARRRR